MADRKGVNYAIARAYYLRWRAFKGILVKTYNGKVPKKALYASWRAFLSGSVIPLRSGLHTSLEIVRLGYQEYKSEFWVI